MSEIRIPTDGKFSQPNRGDIFGNLKSTQNVDLRTNPGRLRLSPRMTVLTKDNDASISNFVLPIGFVNHVLTGSQETMLMATGGGGYGVTGTGKIFTSNITPATTLGSFANLSGSAATNQPTQINDAFSDIVSWNGKGSGAVLATTAIKRTYVSTYNAGHEIYALEGSTWDNAWYSSTRSGLTLINGAPVNMCPAFNGLLYIAQEYSLKYAPITGSIVSPSSVTDPNTTQGTIHTLGKYVITWMRSSSDRIWVGLIEVANGSRYSHLGGYVAEWDGTGTAFNKIYKINAPCALSCTIVNDIPYIIDAYGVLKKLSSVGFIEVARLPVANQNIEMPGIYDMYNNSRWIHTRGMESNGGLIYINVNNYVSAGVYVKDMPSGVWIFDTDNSSQGIVQRNSPCVDSNDYGQQGIQAAGAIFPLRIISGNYLAGASYYSDDVTTQRYAVFYDDAATNTNKRGSFVTPFISSSKLQDHWNEASYRFSTLPSGDKIVGKYRTGKKANLPFIASITWTSTTTFTSTDTNFQYAAVGDEIEGFMGKGASSTAHISATSYSNPTYTITLEEAIGFSSGTAKVKVDNFQKMGQGVISSNTANQDELKIGKTNANIQVKTEMRFTGDVEIDDLTIMGTPHK